MREFIFLFLGIVASFFKSKAVMQAENLALRHQAEARSGPKIGLLTGFLPRRRPVHSRLRRP